MLNKIKKWFRRNKWPKNVMELEECIYPFFLEAVEARPVKEEEYDKLRDVLDRCLEEAYQRLKGNVPNVEINQNENPFIKM